MKNLLSLILCLLCGSAVAQSTNRITAKVVITTSTSNNFAFTLNGDTRTFTNQVTASASQIITNHSVSGSASNLYNHFAASRFSRVDMFGYTNGSNTIYLRGALGLSMSATILSNWATVTYSTQVFSSGLIDVRVPIETEASSRGIEISSLLTRAIGNLATNGIKADATALTNFVGKTNAATLSRKTLTSPITLTPTNWGGVFSNVSVIQVTNLDAQAAQIASGSVSNVYVLNAAAMSGIITRLTNGTLYHASVTNAPWVNATNANLGTARIDTLTVWTGATITNLNAPGSGASSQQIGSSALATNTDSVAFGVGALAYGSRGIAIGTAASANENSTAGIAIGHTSASSNLNSIAIGRNTVAGGQFAIALGRQAKAYSNSSVAIGSSAEATDANQVRLGTAAETVSVPGVLSVEGSVSNSITAGTNSIKAEVSLVPRVNATVISGYVSALNLGTNAFVRITGASGAVTNASFKGGYAGLRVLVEAVNPGRSFVLLDHSSIGSPASTEQINLGTTAGTTLVNMTNNPACFELLHNGTEWLLWRNSN